MNCFWRGGSFCWRGSWSWVGMFLSGRRYRVGFQNWVIARAFKGLVGSCHSMHWHWNLLNFSGDFNLKCFGKYFYCGIGSGPVGMWIYCVMRGETRRRSWVWPILEVSCQWSRNLVRSSHCSKNSLFILTTNIWDSLVYFFLFFFFEQLFNIWFCIICIHTNRRKLKQ